MDSNQTLKQFNKSGFPFQLAVEGAITQSSSRHGWNVANREHPWATETASGFIDIVLEHSQLSTVRIAIECKRIKADDSRQLQWLFLHPADQTLQTSVASCFEVEGRGHVVESGLQAGTHDWSDFRIWDNVRVTPESLQSEFCVLTSDEPSRRPLLERLSVELLDSIEGLAEEEVRIKKSARESHSRLFIFPVIVTNAELVKCSFHPRDVSLFDGSLDPSNIDFEAVPFIRFRKSLSREFPDGWFHSLQAASKARERTVFVVNSSAICEFLTGWEFRPLHDGLFAIQKVLMGG